MKRILRLRVLIVVVLAAAVAAAVSTAMNHKQRLEAMDAAERRRYLGDKLSGRMSDEQIDRIASAVSAKLDGTTEEPENETTEEPEPVADDIAGETAATD